MGDVVINTGQENVQPMVNKCTACHKLHHVAKVYHSKQLINVNKTTKSSNASNSRRRVHTVHKDDMSSDTDSKPQVFIQALQVHGITGSYWFSIIHTESRKITFKPDTGAEASVLPMKIYKKFKNQPMIDTTDTTLSA